MLCHQAAQTLLCGRIWENLLDYHNIKHVFNKKADIKVRQTLRKHAVITIFKQKMRSMTSQPELNKELLLEHSTQKFGLVGDMTSTW